MTEVVELEDGYGILTRCQDCGVERTLDCREMEDRDGNVVRTSSPPNRIAVALAATLLCESCGAKAMEADDRRTNDATVARHVKASGIPEPLARAAGWSEIIDVGRTPDETEARRRAIQAARDWSGKRRPGKGLLLHGDPGTGKTRLAATAAVARMTHSPIRWVSVGVLMAQLDGAWNDDERQQALKVLTDRGPVVLDDFDKVVPNQRMQAALFTALDKRDQSGAAIIVTTNLPPAKLEEKLNEAIVSRLVGMCQVLRYPGPDHRLGLG